MASLTIPPPYVPRFKNDQDPCNYVAVMGAMGRGKDRRQEEGESSADSESETGSLQSGAGVVVESDEDDDEAVLFRFGSEPVDPTCDDYGGIFEGF